MINTPHINQHFKNTICFIDIESTGVNKFKDRIVQIGIVKVFPNGDKEIKSRLINPTIPIPIQASEINGIYDEMVANEPTFAQIAHALYDLIKGCDLAGYNSNSFDIPMLITEFERCGIEFKFDTSKQKMIDVYKIYNHFNSRKLADCYQHYTGKLLVDAHDAEKDALAALEIFEKMMIDHGELKLNDDLFPIDSIDLCGYIGKNNEGELIFLFGKNKGNRLNDDISYCNWIIDKSDFPRRIKNIIASILPSK